MDEIKILKQDVMPVHALPVFKEETNFVLTKDELDIFRNRLVEFREQNLNYSGLLYNKDLQRTMIKNYD